MLKHDGHGLYLRTSKNGTRSWIFRYTHAGQRRDMGLGSADVISRADARTLMRKQHMLLLEGVDPIEARDKARGERAAPKKKAATLDDALRAYAARKVGLNPKTITNFDSPVRSYLLPRLGGTSRSLATITAPELKRAMEESGLWWMPKGDVIRSGLVAMFQYALDNELYAGINPAEKLRNILTGKPERTVENFASLPYAEVPRMWAWLQQYDTIGTLALCWLILNASRPKEARLLRWEYEVEPGLILLPPPIMKKRRPHYLPLSTAARELLERMRAIASSDYVFPGNSQPILDISTINLAAKKATDAYNRKYGTTHKVTAHGYRTSWTSWAKDKTTLRYEARELQIAHINGPLDYDKQAHMLDDRAPVMEIWGHYCSGK